MHQSRILSVQPSTLILLSYFGLKGLVPCHVRGLDILSEEKIIDNPLVHLIFFLWGGGGRWALNRVNTVFPCGVMTDRDLI